MTAFSTLAIWYALSTWLRIVARPASTSRSIWPLGRSGLRKTALSTRSRNVRSSAGRGPDRRLTIFCGKAAAFEPVRARTGSNAAAFPQKMVSLRSGPRPADDLTLRDRVESAVFRNPDLPKGQIDLEVEAGRATIRSHVDNA